MEHHNLTFHPLFTLLVEVATQIVRSKDMEKDMEVAMTSPHDKGFSK